ncbi:MAG: hypothetical protein G8237_00095 [Magnetococcales bacterium]|nr:hypothetical protein [Magnetococcales bacterium]
MVPTAWADRDKLLELIEILHKKGTLGDDEYRQLMGAATGSPPLSEPAKSAPAVPLPEVKSSGGVAIRSADGAHALQLGGRLQLDAGFFQDGDLDLADGSELRRARLDLSGRVARDWKFKLAYDFADNKVDDKTAVIQYEGLGVGALKVGLFSIPFGLSEATGSLHATFMEEAMVVNAFKPDDRIGVGWEAGGEAWSAFVALFGENAGSNEVDDEARGLAVRLTWAPYVHPDGVLHVGGSWLYQVADSLAEGNKDLDGDGLTGEVVRMARFRARPEVHVNQGRLVDTGSLSDVDAWQTAGLELAAVHGPWSVEGEVFRTRVEREAGREDVVFSGYYTSLSWFLTGESRRYQAKEGAFGRVYPVQEFAPGSGGWGAWEVAARYSVLDLTDQSVTGGVERNTTLALNWYPNSRLRWMANYLWVDATTLRNDPQLFTMRLQVDF